MVYFAIAMVLYGDNDYQEIITLLARTPNGWCWEDT